MKTQKIAEKLISYNTVSPIENPEIFEFVKDVLEEEGINPEIREIDGVYNLIAETGKGDTSICLNGHLDVVEPEGNWTETEPFQPRVKDGKLYGRGATDMKAEAAALINAFIDLHNDKDFEGRAVLMLVGDEEVGGFKGSKPLVKQFYQQGKGFDYAVIGEPTDLDIQVGTRGVLWVDIRLEAEGIHASRAHQADIHVMEELQKALEQLNNLEMTYEKPEELPEPSSEVTNLETTEAYNSVPGHIDLGMDIRYLPTQSIKGITKDIEENLSGLEADVDVKVKQDHGGAFLLEDERFRETAVAVMQDLRGERPREITEGGASDGRFFSRKNTPFIELGLNQESVHAENEYCDLEKLKKLRKGYYRIGKQLTSRTQDGPTGK